MLQRSAAREATRFNAGVLSVDARRPLWMRVTAYVMAAVMYLAPLLFLPDEVAQAAPIADPHAPIQFQPTVTQTSTGIPALNIAAPNASGLSANSLQSLNIDPSGLVLNNSLVGGTPLLGGALGANPNLNGRAASVILAQVTSTGAAYRSTLAGPLEIFGNSAQLIISNPNGITINNGLAVTNIANLTLTTGTPQFLTGVGGTATDFAHASAVAFSVTSGDIQINGPPGSNGTPGAGIEGTVGNLDLIAQTIAVNAPLYASQKVNVIAGNQLVTPTASDTTGTTYATASNGTANTLSAIPTSNGLAIDAASFAPITAGQIYVVATAAGMGFRGLGSLAATAGNAVINANGDVTVANTFASQDVQITSAGSTTISGTGLANQNYTVNAGGDITSTGSISAGQNAAMTAGGDLSAASVAANGDATLNAGGSMTLGSVAGQNLSLKTTRGDLTVNSALTAPGMINGVAGRNLTINGAMQGGSTVALTAGQNTTVNGLVSAVGDVSLVAQTGTATTTGAVTTDGQLTVTGQQGVNLGGTTSAQGNATLTSGAGDVTVGGALSTPGQIVMTAGQDVSVAGALHSGQSTTIVAARDAALDGGLEVDGTGSVTVTAGRDLTGGGAVNVANDTTLTAGRNLSVSGAIQTGNDLNASAAQNLSVGATTAVGAETLTATNGSATLNGAGLSGGDLKVAASTDVTANSDVQSMGNLNVDAQGGNLTANGTLAAAGTATLNAGQRLALNGQTTVTKDATLTATNITTQGLSVGGNLVATATGALDTSAGQNGQPFDANAPALSVTGNATLKGANVTTANAVIGGTYSATGTASLTTGGTAAYKGDATLSGGTVTNTGQQMAAGNLTVTGSGVTNQGTLSSLITTTVNATSLNNSGSIYGPTNSLNVTGSTTNSGELFATNALTLTTNALNNSNGLIFAGDVNSLTSLVGDATISVNGGAGTFTNTNGQILAQHTLTLALPNQAFDPSAASAGTLNGGSAFNLSALAIGNSGAWTLPGTAVTVTATQGITNTGTIDQAAGTLTLNGAVANLGTVAANDLTINGSLSNLANAMVQANDAFTLNGAGANAGNIEAVNTLTIHGSSFDNSNGVTRVGNGGSGTGNLNVSLTGDLTNANGTLTATNDLVISANNVINSGASGAVTSTTTTATVLNLPLIEAAGIGSETFYTVVKAGNNGGTADLVWTEVPATIGGLLSATGNVPSATAVWVDSQNIQRDVGLTFTQSNPVATSATVQFVRVNAQIGTDSNGDPEYANVWVVQDGTVTGYTASRTVTLPTVTETTVTSGATGSSGGTIAAGHDLTLTANSLNNQAGIVSAGHDVSLNLQSLSNGGASYSSTVTDTVDSASYSAFLATLQSMDGATHLGMSVPVSAAGQTVCALDGNAFCLPLPLTTFSLSATSAMPSVSSSVTVQGTVGQIVAGHNVNLSGGNLANAGTVAASNDVNIKAAGFTNQGTNVGTMTTTAGCASGYSGCVGGTTTNPNSQSYSYQQNNATVTAGNDIVIAAGSVDNTYGNLVAGRNVVIGGAGTTGNDVSTSPASLTQASAVTNTTGSIEAGNDIDINAATLTNTIAAPVQIHQNYGTGAPFPGCGQHCEAYVDVQSAAPATINANHDVNLTSSIFGNTGSLVTALNNVSITASGSGSNSNQFLNAYWHGDPGGLSAWGCAANATLCVSLYGGAYSGGVNNPAGSPDAVGLPDFVPGTIQAGNGLAVNSPTLTNTGNVIGQQVSLTGATLVNGLTNPNVYTPPPAVSGQVISLGPPAVPGSATTTINGAGLVTTLSGQPVSVTGAAGLPANSPVGVTTVGKPSAPSVQTVAGAAQGVTYLVNSPASAATDDLSPSALLNQLPPSLQPSTEQFYYDPYTQAQQVQQAALEATGKSSFYSTAYGTPGATDNASQASISNQDTAALYGAALQYAEQNNIALGTQLSQQQLALVNTPMLWYVEETVPEPGCTATGNGACPTVQALMPEVLLPQNYAVVNADGEITGSNVALNYANSILNTGSVSASQTLAVDTPTLTNEQRSTNVGTIDQMVLGDVFQTTGSEVQQGGFMSAANYDLNVQQLNQIGGTLQATNADGSVNQAATAQLLDSLKSQLGTGFTQSAVSNHLTTTDLDAPGWYDQLWMTIVVVGIAVISGGAASAAIGAVAASTTAGTATAGSGAMFAAAGTSVDGIAVGAGIGNIAASAAVSGMVSSAITQTESGNGFSLGSLLEAGGTAFLTAGLTNGITLDGGSLGLASVGGDPDSLASLAGVQGLGNSLVPQAGASTASLGTQIEALAAEGVIQAGAQTALEGGSFLTNLRNSVTSDAAAAGAYAIGDVKDAGYFGDGISGELGYLAAHAALGCAAGAASGQGCGGGAIGGAVSATTANSIATALTGGQGVTDQDQLAAIALATMLLGGTAAGLLGQNANAGATAAENETLNNTCGPGHSCGVHIETNPDGSLSLQGETENDAVPIVPRGTPSTQNGQDGEFVVGRGEPIGVGGAPLNPGVVGVVTNAITPPPDTYAVYPLGSGAASGPLPPGYVTVSRWVSPAEASLWIQNQGTAIPSAVPQNGTPQVYVTTAGAPYPPGANGTVRIDFAVPSAMLQPGNASNNFQILQPLARTPIYNVTINVPNGVVLPKAK